jgi:ribosome production factor 1
MGKRQREDDGEEDEGEKELRKAGAKLPSHIKNKHKRSEAYSKLKHEKILDKKKRIKARDLAEKQALELGEVVRNFGFFFFMLLSVVCNSVVPAIPVESRC